MNLYGDLIGFGTFPQGRAFFTSYPNTSEMNLRDIPEGASDQLIAGFPVDTYVTSELVKTNGTITKAYVTDVLKATMTSTTNRDYIQPVYSRSHAATQVITLDWILVRKYASPEPTAQLGTEEILPYIPPDPINLVANKGTDYINWTWQAGSGVTDGFNFTGNTGCTNGTATYCNHTGLNPILFSNITVRAWNNSGFLSTGNVTGSERLIGKPSILSNTICANWNYTVNVVTYYNGASVQTNNSVTESCFTNSTMMTAVTNVTMTASNIIDGLQSSITWNWNTVSEAVKSIIVVIF